MKQYVIDELRPRDHQTLKTYLDARYAVQGFDGLYRIPVPAELSTRLQKEHEACGPFYFAMELLADRLACELLVRGQARMRCDCIGYASAEQRQWFIRFVDDIFDKLSIIT